MQKIIPWISTVIVTIIFGAVAFYYKNEMAQKDIEIQILKMEATRSLTEAIGKIKAADDRVTKRDARAAEQIAVADAATKTVEALAATRIKETSDQATSRMEAVETEARYKLQAANLPEATVEVTFRKALISNGSVARFRNRSQVSTSFTIGVARPATNQNRQFMRVIDGAKITEIGEREGWSFLPGDVIRVLQPEHKPREFSLE